MMSEAVGVLLYVEDDALVQSVVEAGLEEAGFTVITACDGESGLEVLQARIDEIVGVVTDVNLGPGIDGWEVARRSRQLNPNLPVVFVSGKDGHEWTAQGVPRSVMIGKPFIPTQIVVAISSLLNANDQHG